MPRLRTQAPSRQALLLERLLPESEGAPDIERDEADWAGVRKSPPRPESHPRRPVRALIVSVLPASQTRRRRSARARTPCSRAIATSERSPLARLTARA